MTCVLCGSAERCEACSEVNEVASHVENTLPQPDRNRAGKDPCGECHIQPGETCDICGATHFALSEEPIQTLDTPPAMDAQRKFYNACLILINLDMDELVGAGVIEVGNLDRGGSSWKRFTDDPLVFIAKIGDKQRDALWGLIQSRQPKTPEVVEAIG